MTRFEIYAEAEKNYGPVIAFRYWMMMHQHDIQMGMSPLRSDLANRLEELRSKRDFMRRLTKNAVDGYVYLVVHQMDCDCASWSERQKVDATMDAMTAFLDGLYDNAEGPVSWRYITPAQYDEFQRESRDHALEAFEDGHAHVVYA